MKLAIIGAGKFGAAVTEVLLGGGHDITLIDVDEAVIQKMNNRFDIFTLAADARRVDVLKEIGIKDYDFLVTATSDDEQNMLICKIAKKLGCRRGIARVRSPEYVEQVEFLKSVMNIDYIVNPDLACASEIYKYLIEKYSLKDGHYTADGVTILECGIERLPGLAGLQVKDAGPKLDGILIAAVSRDGKIIVPNGNTMLEENDTLYLAGLEKTVNAISRSVRDKKKYTGIRSVMIAGGGKTAYFLAEKLLEFGVSVKIIEVDRARCEYLSDKLDGALVLNADATDTVLLQEENLSGMDAFVALTGFDEENILLSLIAKQHGVVDVVTKISRKSYSPLTDTLGVSMIINPLDICASDILRYTQRGDFLIFSQIIQGQAEFIEIYADSSMGITEKTLAALDIPEGVLIAAIHRKGEIIIPGGATKIQEGDRVIILSLLSSVPELETLIKKGKGSVF